MSQSTTPAKPTEAYVLFALFFACLLGFGYRAATHVEVAPATCGTSVEADSEAAGTLAHRLGAQRR